MSSERATRLRRGLPALLAALAAIGLGISGQSASPRFHIDDPLSIDDDRALDASGARRVEGSKLYDFLRHTLSNVGDRADVPAADVNTMNEVPDSTWFTNRIGQRVMSPAEIARGPNQFETLNVDGWPIVQGKDEGVSPGYRVTDASGHMYQLKFDPPDHPEMSSAAEVIGAAIYHALGYNVVQGYIVEVDPAAIIIAPTATTVDTSGRRRRMTRDDVDQVLQRAARQPDGKYRALASRYADGTPLGYFKYSGTRSDDPNDIYPHEHRRELRGSRVFAAWLNHTDSHAINSLDMLEEAEGWKYIRHYLFDFGAILGSDSTVAKAPRAGNEYLLGWKPGFLTLATLGLYVRPWIRVDYPAVARSVGRFESEFFDPLAWKPDYPNPAFDNLQPDDAFWAASLVARFSDEAIRAVVAKARYSEPGAAEYIAATLIRRRDKVLRAWLTPVNPVAHASLSADGVLTFDNVAVDSGVAAPPASYRVTWSRFDNALGTSVGEPAEMTVTEPRAQAPRGLLAGSEFVSAAIRTVVPRRPRWELPVTMYLRRSPAGWQAVGLDRAAN